LEAMRAGSFVHGTTFRRSDSDALAGNLKVGEAKAGFARAVSESVWKRSSPGTSPTLAFRLQRPVDSAVAREGGESNGSTTSPKGRRLFTGCAALTWCPQSPMGAEPRLRAAANSSRLPSMLAFSHRSSGFVSDRRTFKTAPLHHDSSILWFNACSAVYLKSSPVNHPREQVELAIAE
jgi:hypothetical protein